MKPLRLFSLVLLCALGSARAQTNGIFADFSTSMGDFTVFLNHEAAPRAVASFVGLATGESSWADETGNVWQDRPFYDGSLIHRIVKNTTIPGVTNDEAIQGGGWLWRSVNTNAGVVTTNFTNAGYYQLENLTNGLSFSNGVIAMANSGPNTDGSQFFITVMDVPRWDGDYTVFGHVSTGMNIVTSIAAVAIGTGDRPLVDIVVSNVAIRRVGAAAETFNIASQGVPVVESGPMALARSGTNELLVLEIGEQTEMRFRETSDLVEWETSDWGFNTGSSLIWTTSVSRASLDDSYFFHMSRIWYPVPVTSPLSQRTRTFIFTWDNPELQYSVTFATNWWVQGNGWVKEGTNAPYPRIINVGDAWTRNPYSGRLYFMDDLAREYNYSIGFNPDQATNRFTGYWNHFTNAAERRLISGTFVMQ